MLPLQSGCFKIPKCYMGVTGQKINDEASYEGAEGGDGESRYRACGVKG